MFKSRSISSLAQLQFVLGLATAALVFLTGPPEGDPLSLKPIADRAAAGLIPYRDYRIEYPPLALIQIVLPRFLSGPDPGRWMAVFGLFAIVGATATAACVWWLARHGWSVEEVPETLLVFTGLTLAATPLVIWRFDILPALLAVLALVAFAAGRSAGSGAALALGALAKIYPAFLVPVFAAAHVAERRWRRALVLVSAAAAVGLAVMGLTALVAGSRELSFLTYQEDRGVEIESVAGGLALLAHALASQPARIVFGFGSWQVSSPVIGSLAMATLLFDLLIVVALVAGAWISFTRDVRLNGSVQPRTLVGYSLATLLAVILTNKVLSPQYVVWLLPFAALLSARKTFLLLAVVILTTVIYPLTFEQLVYMRTPAIVALNLRNVLLVVFYAWVVWPEPARQPAVQPPIEPARRAGRSPALVPAAALEGGDVREAAHQTRADAEDQ